MCIGDGSCLFGIPADRDRRVGVGLVRGRARTSRPASLRGGIDSAGGDVHPPVPRRVVHRRPAARPGVDRVGGRVRVGRGGPRVVPLGCLSGRGETAPGRRGLQRGDSQRPGLTGRHLSGGAQSEHAAPGIDELLAQRRAIEVQVAGQLHVAAAEDAARLRDALGTAGRTDVWFALVLKALTSWLFVHFLRLLPHALDAFDDFGFIKLD